MGAHGPAIFDDDVAMDVRATFEDALADEGNVRTATRQVLDEYKDALDDVDDGPIVWLALAALQLEHGTVQTRVRREALRVITAGDDLARWEDAGPEALAERQQILMALQVRLEALPPTQ